MGVPIPPVDYTFETSAGNGDWHLLSFQLNEEISALYRCKIRLCQPEEDGSDVSAFMGSDCVISLNRDSQIERRQCGLVRRSINRGIHPYGLVVDLEVVPAFFALTQRVSSRIFQDQDAGEIIKAVLEEALADYNREVSLDDVKRPLPKREYTVQHRESDFDFVTRLMEEEGIAYYFDHSGDVEKLVLIDNHDATPPIETVDGVVVPVVPDSHGTQQVESLSVLRATSNLQATSVVVRDFDFSNPGVDLTREARGTDALGKDRELYESGYVTTIGDYQPTAYGAEDGQDQADLRQEAEKSKEIISVGRSDVINMRAGVHFETTGHADPAMDIKHLVTKVTHKGDAPAPTGMQAGDDDLAYSNEIECRPFDVPHRPERRRPEPRILGAQTATVVGPSGEEVYTDEHGRIKVQFHWDRGGEKDEHSSCWIRVAQTWAGAGFGTVFLPRIGMEVIVTFLDGHPDHPVVIGCLYNGANPAPYALPDEKTKSTIYTNSSIGGSGHNELTFEDAKDKELIYTHAQKDMDTMVKNDQSTTVDNDKKLLVKNDYTGEVQRDSSTLIKRDNKKVVERDKNLEVQQDKFETVKRNKAIKVKGKHKEEITGTMGLTVGDALVESIGADHSEEVAGDLKISVSGATSLSTSKDFTNSVEGNKNEGIKGDSSEDIKGGVTLDIGKNYKVTVTKDYSLSVKKALKEDIKDAHKHKVAKEYTLNAKKIQLVGKDQIQFKAGKAEITLKKNGDVTINGKKITIKGSGPVVTKGSKIGEN